MSKLTENTFLPISLVIVVISSAIGIVTFMNTTYLTGQATARVAEENSAAIQELQKNQQNFNSLILEKVTRIDERVDFLIKQQRGKQ